MARPEDDVDEALPAWSLPAVAVERIGIATEWPEVTRDWAWAKATGAGVRVCILDSGVEAGHPLVGEVQGSVVIAVGDGSEVTAAEDTEGDLCGHGTARAPGSSARVPPNASSGARGSSAPATRARARFFWRASAGRSKSASTSST